MLSLSWSYLEGKFLRERVWKVRAFVIVADCLEATRKLRRAVVGSILVCTSFNEIFSGRKGLVRRKLMRSSRSGGKDGSHQWTGSAVQCISVER